MSLERKYKGFLIFIAILIVINLILWGVVALTGETSLKQANKSFKEKQYANAIPYYEKAIFEDDVDGVLLTKLGYCLEKTASDDELMKKCYSSAVSLFESNSDTETDWYKVAVLRVQQNNLTSISAQEGISDIKKYLREKNNLTFFDEIGTFGLIFFLLVGLFIYIIGLSVASKTNCVIVYGKVDAVLLFIPCIAFFLLRSVSSSLVTVIFFVWFLITLVFTVRGNYLATKGRFFPGVIYISLSLLTKLTLVFLLPIMVLIALTSIVNTKKDKRYRDGTKNNEKTARIAEVSFLYGLLVIPLIKDKSDFE